MTILKEVRLKLGITQQEMANGLKIPLRKYRRYELGEQVIDHQTMAKIIYIRNKGNDREIAKILKELIKEGWYDEK